MTMSPAAGADRIASTAILHYIYDPLCGWCYAAAPLVDAARAIPGLAIALHAGGMMSGANRRRIDARWRDYVIPHDRRIAQISGQPFGDAYFDGLLRDTSAVMDSTPPITAILATQQSSGRGLDMLHRLQRAHYVEGRRITDVSVLSELAADVGLDPVTFNAAMQAVAGTATARHIDESRALLSEVGGHGFPTFALQVPDGDRFALDIGPCLGKPEAWKQHLIEVIGGAIPCPSTRPARRVGPAAARFDKGRRGALAPVAIPSSIAGTATYAAAPAAPRPAPRTATRGCSGRRRDPDRRATRLRIRRSPRPRVRGRRAARPG